MLQVLNEINTETEQVLCIFIGKFLKNQHNHQIKKVLGSLGTTLGPVSLKEENYLQILISCDRAS
jgi:hypothetical protein